MGASWRGCLSAPNTTRFEMTYDPAKDPEVLNGPKEAHGFRVGDMVQYTNPAGLKFGPYKIVGFRVACQGGTLPRNTVYINSSSPWYPVEPESLKRVSP